MIQNIKKQNEKKTTSTNEFRTKKKSKHENQKKSQTQNFDKIITNDRIRQRNSIIFARS